MLNLINTNKNQNFSATPKVHFQLKFISLHTISSTISRTLWSFLTIFFREREREKVIEMNSGEAFGAMEAQYIGRHHRHEPRENQCTSALVKHIKAPVHLVCFSLLSTADHHFLWFLFHFPVVDFFDFFFFARIFRWGLTFFFSFLDV